MKNDDCSQFDVEIRDMSTSDLNEVFAFWGGSDGVGLTAADSLENISRFLQRNPGLSFVARLDNQLVGAVLCGHDGRSGYIHHLAVSPKYRRKRIGYCLVNQCVEALKKQNLNSCHVFVYEDNKDAISFWESMKWGLRSSLRVMSNYFDVTT